MPESTHIRHRSSLAVLTMTLSRPVSSGAMAARPPRLPHRQAWLQARLPSDRHAGCAGTPMARDGCTLRSLAATTAPLGSRGEGPLRRDIDGQELHARPLHRLRVELHQFQNLAGHADGDGQPQLGRLVRR